MFGQQPWYRSYPPNVSYDPYLHSSYQSPSSFEPIPVRNGHQFGLDEDRARALAEQRARRAQYLPDEVEEDDEDDWGYNQFSPRERAYLEARRQQEILERMKQEEETARQRALEEQKWQKALEQRQREDQEVRQKLLEERKRQMRLKREEEARKMAAEREKVDLDSLLTNVAVANRETRLSQQQQEMHARRDRSRSNGREQARSPARQEATSIPIHVHRNSQSSTHSPSSPSKSSIPVPEPEQSTTRAEGSSRPATSRTPPAKSPSPISRHSLEEQNEAASRIQNRYRIHASLRALDNLATQFETLKKNFVYPRTIDFQKPGSDGGHISVGAYRPPSDFDNEDEMQPMDVDGPEGKLDYTSTNFALNSYMDSLDKLLMKLDGVESWGRKEIRLKRRSIVKTIEKEVSKVDRYWKQAWMDYLAKQASESKADNGERANISITSQSQPPTQDSLSEEQSMEGMEE